MTDIIDRIELAITLDRRDDLTVLTDARSEIIRLRKALEPFANLYLYPYDIEGQLEFEKEQLDWSEEENDKVQDDFFITRKAIRNARKALGE